MKRLLILSLFLVGCNPPAATNTKPALVSSAAVQKKSDHDHDHGVGPHQGTIFDFGKYHAEFTVDHKTKTVHVYILGDDMDTPVPVSAEKLELSIKNPAFTVELKPQPDTGDKDGKSSRFTATHENFAREQEFAGTLAGLVEGKPASGEFEEKAHGPVHGKDGKK
ncbi:MAG TPA: hypothetical protein PKA06_14400 [Gemmatales bacterium]|nr:hypothetical protein [Gemmatales bacterium]HMP17054.1 hypothetical protein [Gemmatales bacterium]